MAEEVPIVTLVPHQHVHELRVLTAQCAKLVVLAEHPRPYVWQQRRNVGIVAQAHAGDNLIFGVLHHQTVCGMFANNGSVVR